MAERKIADWTPVVTELDPGEYWWCACGRSQNQPWCDGSHKGTGIEPVRLEIEEKKRYALCRCKHTKTMPFCDGTHSELKKP
jgi:CDGSH-type Zn-finger protein